MEGGGGASPEESPLLGVYARTRLSVNQAHEVMVVGCERDEGADGPANCPRPTFDNGARALFLFLYFSISFFTKIYFCFRNLQEYTPAAPLPGGRHLAAPLPGDRGISAKSFAENLRPDP